MGPGRSGRRVVVVSHASTPPGRRWCSACGVRVHEPEDALVAMVRAIRRCGGPVAVGAVFAHVFRSARITFAGRDVRTAWRGPWGAVQPYGWQLHRTGERSPHEASGDADDARRPEIDLLDLRAATRRAPERTVTARTQFYVGLQLRFERGTRVDPHGLTDPQLFLARWGAESQLAHHQLNLDPADRRSHLDFHPGTGICRPDGDTTLRDIALLARTGRC